MDTADGVANGDPPCAMRASSVPSALGAEASAGIASRAAGQVGGSGAFANAAARGAPEAGATPHPTEALASTSVEPECPSLRAGALFVPIPALGSGCATSAVDVGASALVSAALRGTHPHVSGALNHVRVCRIAIIV